MIRDLVLSKESAQRFKFRLHGKDLLAPGIHFAWYRKCKQEPLVYFRTWFY